MAEPRWLTDEQQRAWRRFAAVMTRLPTELDRQLQRDSDLSQFEYWVLAMLSEAPDRRLQLKTLASDSNSSLSRLSHGIQRLESRGLVKRVPSPDDARANDAVLTSKGWKVVVQAAPGHAGAVRDFVFDGLTAKDVSDLARICERIAKRLECPPSSEGT